MAKKTSLKNKKPAPKQKVTAPKKNLFYILLAVAGIITFISFFPSLFNRIDIWDDFYYLSENPLIKHLSWTGIKEIFSTPYLANYQPLTILTYSLEYYFFKLSAFPYHLNNVILHILNVVLLLWFVNKLTSEIFVAFIAALLFGIHPLHVESVTWVSGRKDVLYAFFFILGMLSYLKYKDSKDKKYYIITLILFILSCLSKGMAVTFPVILVLIDYFKDTEFKLSKQLDKIPFFLISLIFGIITYKVQKSGGAVAFASNEAYTLSDRILFANYSLFFYIYKMLLPWHLSGLYPYPQNAGAALPAAYYISPFINALFLAWIIFSIKKSKKIIFGSLFFLAAIFPVLQIVSIGAAIAADRYFYIASVGLFYLAGVGFCNMYENGKFKSFRTVIVIACSVIIMLFCGLTFRRAEIWKDPGTFWGNVAEEFPKLELPYYNRAAYFFSEKKYDNALADFSKALSIYPGYKDALKWRAETYIIKKQYQMAAEDISRLVKLDSSNFDNNYKLGEIYGKYLKNPENSEKYLLKAHNLKPGDAGTLMNLGVIYGMKGDNKKALVYFNKVIEINPDDTNALKNIAIAYKLSGDEKNANEYLARIKMINGTKPIK